MISRIKTKLTLFLIVGLVTILYSIPAFFYSLTLTGGGSLIGLVYIELIVVAAAAIIIDYVLVKNIKLKMVWLAEILLSVFAYALISYITRKVIVDIQQLHKPYLIVVYSSKGKTINDFSSGNIFDKEYVVKDTDLLFLNPEISKDRTLTYKYSKSSDGITEYAHNKPEYNFNWEFIQLIDQYHYTDKQMDSILKAKLPKNTVILNPSFKGY